MYRLHLVNNCEIDRLTITTMVNYTEKIYQFNNIITYTQGSLRAVFSSDVHGTRDVQDPETSEQFVF